MNRVVLLLSVFVIKCHSLFAQQWVWDEMSKEEREPISFGGIVLFAIVVFIGYLIFKIISSNKKGSPKNNYNTNSSTRNQTNSDVVTHSNNSNISSPKIIKPEPQTPIEIEGFTLSSDGTRLIKGSDIEECHIPYGIKVVCRNAFKDALKIKSLYISETVEEVEDFAFASLNIEKVFLPKSISKWGENVFFMCAKLREVVIDPELCTWGECMFSYCSSLEKIEIPSAMKEITIHSFDGCNSLSTVILHEKLEKIGDGAFLGCENLIHIELPNSIKSIGNGAFQECQRLKSINLPSSLEVLSDNVFMYCFNLEEIVIPEGVVAIGKSCFYNCCELKTIQLPASLFYIDDEAFKDCYGITIKVPFHSELDEFYNSHALGNDCEIIRYEAHYNGNLEEDKKKCERILFEQKNKRERDNYEFRKEMGLLTKEEYERENDLYLDVTNDQDDWDDI